jgi:hypothetical protein
VEEEGKARNRLGEVGGDVQMVEGRVREPRHRGVNNPPKWREVEKSGTQSEAPEKSGGRGAKKPKNCEREGKE